MRHMLDPKSSSVRSEITAMTPPADREVPAPSERILRWTGLVALVAATIILLSVPVTAGTVDVSFDDILGGSMPLWWLVTGLVVMAKRPWHQVGWLLILIGLGIATTGWGPGAEAYFGVDARVLAWLAWVNAWGGYFSYAALVALLVLFPDGQSNRSAVSRRRGRSVIGFVTALTLLAMMSDPVGGVDAAFPEAANPLGVRLIPRAAVDFGHIVVFLIIAGCVRWMWKRRAGESGESRNRYTLLLYSFSLLIISLVAGIALSETLGDGAWLPAFVMWFLVPVAFSVSVIRHGLYGVDRLVRRTLSYGLVAAVIGAIYAVPVVVIPSILGQTSDLVIAGATLAAAGAFNPVRRRIQKIVEQRFNRSRYDGRQEVQAFGERLKAQTDLSGVQNDLIGVVERTMQPQVQMVWIKP